MVAGDKREAAALIDRIAPEHLVVDREALIKGPITAGAVFVGPFTAQAAGRLEIHCEQQEGFIRPYRQTWPADHPRGFFSSCRITD